MRYCIQCGDEIKDTGHLKEVLGLKNDPKYCEKCRRKIRGYRNKNTVERIEIKRWDNCIFRNFPFKPEKSTNDVYDIYYIGGRNWGNWGGVEFKEKYLIFINKGLDPEKPVMIRKMEKTWKKINTVNNKEIITTGTNEYLTIDQAQDTELPKKNIYYFCDYYKTTLKGNGRDRNLKHQVSGEYDIILNGNSSCRSGRHGNSWELIVGKNLKITETGIS